MARDSRNSVQFSAETIAKKPAWLQRQLAALEPTPPAPAPTPVPPPLPAKSARKTKAQAPRKGKQRVARTRNMGTWTEAKYWQTMRSALRRTFRFWKPAVEALKRARVATPGKRGRKWSFLCADCEKLFQRDGVQIDHIEPCGKLTCLEDIPAFLARLTPESPDAYAVRCLECHQKKTNTERNPLP